MTKDVENPVLETLKRIPSELDRIERRLDLVDPAK